VESRESGKPSIDNAIRTFALQRESTSLTPAMPAQAAWTDDNLEKITLDQGDSQ
jgi:hypothetical protein